MRYLSLFYSPAARLITVMLILAAVGAMPLWSQSSGSSLSGSDNTLRTWNELYGQGQKIYERQSNTLTNLNREISALRTGYAELTNLSAELSRSNESLRIFSEQIGQRMQERDEDLAWAYSELDAKSIVIAEKNALIWKLVAAVIGLGAVILGIAAFAAFRFFLRRKIPALF